MANCFPESTYKDVPGLCKAASLEEIKAQGWSLNPVRYVGTREITSPSDSDFKVTLARLHEEIDMLSDRAQDLQEQLGGQTRILWEL